MSSISNIASLPGSPIAGGQGPAIPMTRAAVPTSAPGDLRRAAIQDAHAFRAMPPAALRLHQAVRPPSDATAHAAAPDLAAAIATIVGAMGRQQHILHRCEAGALMWVPAPAAPAPKGPLGAHPLQRPVATAAERDAL
ncbi:MAG TPA: hypothetical protein VFH51_11295, partial [Myxococcota bacterium]|nr:hypothetical protein [Myxococcota bacterium]